MVHVARHDAHVLLLRGEHPPELAADVGADPRDGPLPPRAQDPHHGQGVEVPEGSRD